MYIWPVRPAAFNTNKERAPFSKGAAVRSRDATAGENCGVFRSAQVAEGAWYRWDYVTPPSFRCYGTFGKKNTHTHTHRKKQQGMSTLVKIFSRKCRSTVLFILKDFLIMLKLPLSHWNLVGFSPHHELQVHHEFVQVWLTMNWKHVSPYHTTSTWAKLHFMETIVVLDFGQCSNMLDSCSFT